MSPRRYATDFSVPQRLHTKTVQNKACSCFVEVQYSKKCSLFFKNWFLWVIRICFQYISKRLRFRFSEQRNKHRRRAYSNYSFSVVDNALFARKNQRNCFAIHRIYILHLPGVFFFFAKRVKVLCLKSPWLWCRHKTPKTFGDQVGVLRCECVLKRRRWESCNACVHYSCGTSNFLSINP